MISRCRSFTFRHWSYRITKWRFGFVLPFAYQDSGETVDLIVNASVKAVDNKFSWRKIMNFNSVEERSLGYMWE